MSEPKKQHYVPRFYLKNFGSPIYCYDKLEDKVFPRDHKDLGHENYFYEIDDVPQGTLEGLLAKMDGICSQAYNKLIQTRDLQKLSQSEKMDLFIFLAFQFLRTGETRLGFKEISEKTLNSIFGENGMKMIPKELKVTYTADSIKKIQAQMLIENSARLATIFSKKKWVVRENNTDVPLWTSDNPIALHNQLKFSNGWGNLGLTVPGIEIHFPLTSNLIMFSHDPTTHKLTSGEMSREHIIRHNNYQVTSSIRFLYSRSPDFDIARGYLKKQPKFKNPDRDRGKFSIKKGNGFDMIIFDRTDE